MTPREKPRKFRVVSGRRGTELAYKSIVTVFTDIETDSAVLTAAIKLAERDEGHLGVLCLGIDRTQPGFYYAGANAFIMQENIAQAQSDAAALEAHVTGILEHSDITWATFAATTQMAGLTQLVAHRARLADLAVLAKPYGPGRGYENEAIAEAILFDSHVPVLVIPDGGAYPDPVRQAVIAWNESTEALVAIRAALPILRDADRVNVAIVDPPSHGPDRSDPGGQLCQMLARHGVRAEVAVLSKTMPRVSDVLCRHCNDRAANLLVMGAYGHSRFRESILGGATRNMLETTELPVLLAH